MELTPYQNYPITDMFSIVGEVSVPHPYVITPKHIEFAADKFFGILDEHVFIEADKEHIKCGAKDCKLSYKEHEKALTVQCITNKQIKDINEPLIKYLNSILEQSKTENYAGFVFLQKSPDKVKENNLWKYSQK